MAERDKSTPKQPTGEWWRALTEPAATLLTGAAAAPVAGVGGLLSLLAKQDPKAAADVVQRLQSEMTYEPRTVRGFAGLAGLGAAVEPLNRLTELPGRTLGQIAPASGALVTAALSIASPRRFNPKFKDFTHGELWKALEKDPRNPEVEAELKARATGDPYAEQRRLMSEAEGRAMDRSVGGGQAQTASPFRRVPERVFYRGTNPGSTARITTGKPEWDSHLFMAANEKAASGYGSNIEKFEAAPDARILREGTAEWVRVAGRWRKNESMLDYADRAASAAKAAGYDAAQFKRQGDLGTAVFNPDKFKKMGQPTAQTASRTFSPFRRVTPRRMTAYHGSPHDFDEFDIAHLNSGEGAQAIAHGLYYAEHPDVATGYRDNLSGTELRIGNDRPLNNAPGEASNYLRAHGGNITNALDEIENYSIPNTLKIIDQTPMLKQRTSFNRKLEDLYNSRDYLQRLKDEGVEVKLKTNGKLYTVDIPHSDYLLDWDKPLKGQPKAVREAVARGMRRHKWPKDKISDVMETATGQQAMQYLMPSGEKAEAAQTLRKFGVPGVKYLDRFSRRGGEGTSNYVIFHHDDVVTKHKEARGGLVAFARGGFWKKVKKFGKKVVDFEKDHFQHLASGIKHDPKRLILGVDPISTKVWNKALGQHDKELVNYLGGPTKEDYKSAAEKGIDIGPGKTVNDIAGMVAGAYAGGALGQVAGAGLGSAGVAVSPTVQTGLNTAGRLATVSANQASVGDVGGLTQVAPFNSGPGEPLNPRSAARHFDFNWNPSNYGMGPEHVFTRGAARGGRAMPSSTPKQARFMRALAHGWHPRHMKNPPSQKVASEFMRADEQKKHFQTGGLAMATGGMAGLIKDAQDKIRFGGSPTNESTVLQPYTPLPPPTSGFEHGEPGSITRMLWDRYQIVDPTATNYDQFKPVMEDPYRHMAVDDPTRIQYQQWDTSQRGGLPPGVTPPLPGGAGGANAPGSMYGPMDTSSPYRDQLRAHRARIQDILGRPRGAAQGGPVRMAFGGQVPPVGMAPPQQLQGGLQMAAQPQAQPMVGGTRPPPLKSRWKPPPPPGMMFPRPTPQIEPGGPQMLPPMGGGLRPGNRPLLSPDQVNAMNSDPSRFAAGPVDADGNALPPQGMPPQGDMGMPMGPSMPVGGTMGSEARPLGPPIGGPRVPPNLQGLLQRGRVMNRPAGMGRQRQLNRIGTGDQQGGLARAMQTQTGRPPISRRMAFPGTR